MRFSIIALLSILFFQGPVQNTSVEERKSNMVVKILDRILQDVTELTTKNISIPFIDLGEIGSAENVIVSLPKITNKTDGVGSFGFQLLMNVSEITATGRYDVKDMDLPGLLPISGKGNFLVSLEVVNLKVKIKAAKNFEKDKFDFDLDTFNVQLGITKLNFENLMFDPYVSDFLNEILGNLLPSLVEAFVPSLKNLMLPLLDYYGNGVVNCITTELGDLENCIKNLFETIVDDIVQQLV